MKLSLDEKCFAIKYIMPDAEVAWGEPEGIMWLDSRSMPSDEEIEAAHNDRLLSVARTAAIQQIASLFDQALLEIQSHYPQAERETWYKQELEAKAYLNNSNADTSFISKLATKRDITLDEMVAAIIDKVDQYEDVVSTAMEKRRKLLHKVNEELTSLEDLQNFNVQEEWDKP